MCCKGADNSEPYSPIWILFLSIPKASKESKIEPESLTFFAGLTPANLPAKISAKAPKTPEVIILVLRGLAESAARYLASRGLVGALVATTVDMAEIEGGECN